MTDGIPRFTLGTDAIVECCISKGCRILTPGRTGSWVEALQVSRVAKFLNTVAVTRFEVVTAIKICCAYACAPCWYRYRQA